MTDNLPARILEPTDVASALHKLPMISAEQYQHVGRYAGAVVMSGFEQVGGMTRFVEWADSNPTDFYTKMFGKLVARSQQVDISGTLSIDDAINRLESQRSREDGYVVDAEFDTIQEYDL